MAILIVTGRPKGKQRERGEREIERDWEGVCVGLASGVCAISSINFVAERNVFCPVAAVTP